MTEPLFERIAIVGVGLLGGSLGMAAKASSICREVVGIGRSAPTLEEARRLEAIDRGSIDLIEGIADADLIVLCTPVRHILEVLPQVVAAAKPGTIITDVGSTKASIVQQGEAACAGTGRFFVGSHPMAGSEKSGVRHARTNLYADSTCFVTPTPTTHLPAFTRVAALWKALDARIVIARPERHDRLVASISHLPHMVAVALVRTIDRFNEDKNLVKGIIGNGFRDTTRIACGDSRMWDDICTDNHAEIDRARHALESAIHELMGACTSPGSESLRTMLDDACEYREFLDHR